MIGATSRICDWGNWNRWDPSWQAPQFTSVYYCEAQIDFLDHFGTVVRCFFSPSRAPQMTTMAMGPGQIKWLSAHATIDRNVLVNRSEAWILTHSQTRGDITSRRLSVGNCVLWLLKRPLGKLAIELEMIWRPSDPQLISPRLEWAARPTLPEICGKELSVMHLEQGTWFLNKSNLWDLTPLVHVTCRWDLPTSMTWASVGQWDKTLLKQSVIGWLWKIHGWT